MINWIDRLPPYSGAGLLLVADGGATNCRVAICSADGTLIGYHKAHGRPTNARVIGEAAAGENLVFTANAAMRSAGVSTADIETCLITSASVDTLARAASFDDALGAAGLAHAVRSTVPDTMGCWASTDSLGPAAAIIAGTGSVAVAADRERRIWRRFGGWDFVLGDEGSGYALGRRALQETLLVHEGRSEASALAEAVMQHWGGTDVEGLPDDVHYPTIDKAWIASFAPIVTDLAAAGDLRALEIIDDEVTVLAEAALAAVAVLRGDERSGRTDAVPVGLFGGIAKDPVFQDRFRALMGERSDVPLRFVIPEHSALVGAAALAMIDRDPQLRAEALDRLDAAVDVAVAAADAAARGVR